MRANPYHPATAHGYCTQGAHRFFDVFGVTAGEAERARPCGQGTVRCRPFLLNHSNIAKLITSEAVRRVRPQGAFLSGRYDLTGGVAWCASPCGSILTETYASSSVDRAEVIG